MFNLESAVDQGSIYFVSFVVIAFVVFGVTILWASMIAPGEKHDGKK